MRLLALFLGIALAIATKAHAAEPLKAAPLPWCAPEVTELSDHVCFFDPVTRPEGKRRLVIYLHGMLATNPGFQYLQHRTLALQAKHLGFTVLMPTAPRGENSYSWPSGGAALKELEPVIVAGLQQARKDLEARLGTTFEETFVVGFSSGAYYGSSLAVRSVLDVDGYIVLAGGSSWMRPPSPEAKRAPVFVGVSASDSQTAEHSRAFAGTLTALRWPHRTEERDVGHLVDPTFLARGLHWLGAQHAKAAGP